MELELVRDAKHAYDGQKSHLRVAGRRFTICGQYGHGSQDTNDLGWYAAPGDDPSCGRCANLRAKAEAKAAAMLPPDPPVPGQTLLVVIDWEKNLPGARAYGRPDFKGQRLVVLPQHTLADLSEAIWNALDMGRIHENDCDQFRGEGCGYTEGYWDHAFTFEFEDGRMITHPELIEAGMGVPRRLLISSENHVSDVLGRGDHLTYTWDLGIGFSAMVRVAREDAPAVHPDFDCADLPVKVEPNGTPVAFDRDDRYAEHYL